MLTQCVFGSINMAGEENKESSVQSTRDFEKRPMYAYQLGKIHDMNYDDRSLADL